MAERRFDLLIFDWDGTLSDSAGMIVRSMQSAIRDLNLPPRTDVEIGNLIGLGLAEGMQMLYPQIDTQELIRLLMGYRARFTSTVTEQEAGLFAGAQAALENLFTAGYQLAVATGKSRRGLDRSLRHHSPLVRLFASTRTADETANKPDPLMLQELLEEFGLPAERALMIGDTEYDAAMARSIGMPMVGVTCGVHEPDRMRAAGAVALIETVADLPGWLAR